MATGFSPRVVRLPRTAALAELECLVGQALVASSRQDGAGEFTVSSTLRPGRHTVVAVGGEVAAEALRMLGAHLAGLINTGTRYLVVDLSRTGRIGHDLLDLLHRVEDRMDTLDGVLELTGLVPSVLYEMDDGPLALAFAQYRATLDGGEPLVSRWSALRFPQGLDDVAEPGSAVRYRAFIDTAAHGRGERLGRRR